MAVIDYPTTLDTLNNPDDSSGDKLDTAGVLHDDQHQEINDIGLALEAKVGVDRSAVTSSHEYWLRLGWIFTADTWVYATATTFTIASVDRTSELTPGTRIQLTQSTGGTKYWVVASSTFSTNTTVTIIETTDYTLENEAITGPFYSYVANPQAFPGWFAYTALFRNLADDVTEGNLTKEARFFVVGKMCMVVAFIKIGSTTSVVTAGSPIRISLPTTSGGGGSDLFYMGTSFFVDDSTSANITTDFIPYVNAGVIDAFFNGNAASNATFDTPFTLATDDFIKMTVVYEIA